MTGKNPRQVSVKTHKMLWGRAASCCAFSDCRRELVIDRNAVDNASLFGEECHIVAKEPDGPRGISPLTSKERDAYENLILLCSNHHKIIDDQPNTYPVARLQQMKADHEQWVHDTLQGISPIWSVPYHRNLFFTGRDDLLDLLHDRLTTTKATALTQPQALSGLGGIGKTQIAIEYAYTYRAAYRAVFWVRASTYEELLSDYVSIADRLSLPQKDEQDQNKTVAAVKQWFEAYADWLLILDNADDLDMVRDFLPTVNRGHLILTTPAKATGTIAHPIFVKKLDLDEGMLLLLRRSQVLTEDATLDQIRQVDQTTARAIADRMDGLPLALDLAGAYIEQTGCSLAQYLDLYQQHRSDLLSWRAGLSARYPYTVATTWSLSFQKVEQANPVAAELLRFCAFLAPDRIPEELIRDGAKHWNALSQQSAVGPSTFHQMIEELLKFSLVERLAETQTLSIHRLVQAVLKDGMSKQERKLWSEKTVRAVQKAFPAVNYTTLVQCGRFLSHALSCADLIEHENMTFIRAGILLHQTGVYLTEQARYKEAEALVQRALKICEQHLAPTDIKLAVILTNLAVIYCNRGKDDKELEPMVKRALEICEQHLTLAFHVLDILCNCAWIRHSQGRDVEAEVLLQRALKIGEQRRETDHPDLAPILHNLAQYYYDRMEYVKAEEFLQRALKMHEQQCGQMHPKTPAILNGLARIYRQQGKDSEAQQFYQISIKITEQQLGSNHPDLVPTLSDLAQLYRNQGIYLEAEKLLLRALAICTEQLESNHSNTGVILEDLALYYHSQGKGAEAEKIIDNILKTYENHFGPNHFKTASILNILGELYRNQGKFLEAEGVMQRALAICEQQLGLANAVTVKNMSSLGWLYHEQNKDSEAMLLLQRVLEISKQKLNEEWDDTMMLQVFAQTDIYIKILSKRSSTNQ